MLSLYFIELKYLKIAASAADPLFCFCVSTQQCLTLRAFIQLGGNHSGVRATFQQIGVAFIVCDPRGIVTTMAKARMGSIFRSGLQRCFPLGVCNFELYYCIRVLLNLYKHICMYIAKSAARKPPP